MNVTVGNQIRALYEDRRVILLQTFQNRILRIQKVTGTGKALN